MPAFQRVFFFSNFLNHAFSYKVTKKDTSLKFLLEKRPCSTFYSPVLTKA